MKADLLREIEFGHKPLDTLYDFQKKYGDIFRLDVGGLPTVFISDPEELKEAFKKEVRLLTCFFTQRLLIGSVFRAFQAGPFIIRP